MAQVISDYETRGRAYNNDTSGSLTVRETCAIDCAEESTSPALGEIDTTTEGTGTQYPLALNGKL